MMKQAQTGAASVPGETSFHEGSQILALVFELCRKLLQHLSSLKASYISINMQHLMRSSRQKDDALAAD